MKSPRPSRKGSSPRAASRPLRVAVCGCGVWGRTHVRNLLALPGVDLVALADDNHAACSRLRDEELVPKGKPCSIFHTLDEQLRLARLDAVVIATPHYLRYPQALAALKAGVHVLIEKPMVTSTRHAAELVTLARRSRRLLAVSFPGVCSNELHYVRNLISRGGLGQLSSIEGCITQDWLAASRGTWHLHKQQAGGGFLYDTASHLLHAILWLTGLRPVEVFADVNNRHEEVEVVGSLLIRFENGVLASLLADGDARHSDSTIRITGSRGAVVTSAYGGLLQHYEDHTLLKYPPVPDFHMTTQSNFVDAVRGRSELASPGDWGLKLCRLMDAVYASARTRKPVKIRPK